MAKRNCDGCTVCCTVLAVKPLNKPKETACPHAFAGHGCARYDLRPEPCRNFGCLWFTGGIPEPARPDKIGAMFVVGRRDTPLALAIGRPLIQAHECKPGGFDHPITRNIIDAISDVFLVDVIRGEMREFIGPAWVKAKVEAILEGPVN